MSLYKNFLFIYFYQVGLGFLFNKGAYLRDTWNILDFVVVCSAFIPYLLSGSSINLTALRALRVLRPLRTVTSIKSLKQILKALFTAIPMMMNSLIILLFFYIVFSIGGL